MLGSSSACGTWVFPFCAGSNTIYRVPPEADDMLTGPRPSSAQQAEAFRIRVLVGPMLCRDDETLEHMAELIGRGEWRFDADNGIIELEKGDRIQLLENGTFQALI